jgi:hypothetical protein
MAGVACVVEPAMCFNYLRSPKSTYYRAPLLGELMVVHMTFLVALQQLGVLPLFGQASDLYPLPRFFPAKF